MFQQLHGFIDRFAHRSGLHDEARLLGVAAEHPVAEVSNGEPRHAPGASGPKAAMSSGASSAGGAALIQSIMGWAASPSPGLDPTIPMTTSSGTRELPKRAYCSLDQGFGSSADLRHTVQVALSQVCAWPGIDQRPNGRVRSLLGATNFGRLEGCVRVTHPSAGPVDHDR